MNKTKLESHLAQLEQRHEQLKKQVKEGYSYYLDDPHLSKLKQEKLHVKREIENTRKQLEETQ